jgi:arylsulfatase A-like enzyme
MSPKPQNHYRYLLLVLALASTLATAANSKRPNVLFISIDDLNDWIGCLGGHPQAKTPNIDRLAKSGTLFTNAHCAAPACNPSRTAVMTGTSPGTSGLYGNGQNMRDILPDAVLLPKYFANHGYWAGGSGKLLHYFIDARSWDEYFPAKETEDPFPRTVYPDKRPVNLPRGGPWQYIETDWAALDVTDQEFGGDWQVAQWVGDQLRKKHEKSFFLACGIYRPHEPWFVPAKYFDQFPLEDIQLPPGYKEDDLADLPPEGLKIRDSPYFSHIREHKQWKQAIQGYLASIAFADAMVGRVLDALESGPNRDNTIVVLWSDHGWHLGEKMRWQKFTGWRVSTRVPLIVRVPAGTPGLPQGTKPGTTCGKPVSLLSLFPTLTQLVGIPQQADNDGPSIVRLLRNPKADWPHVAITHLQKPGSYGLSAERWRYIHYSGGDEEFYDIQNDPYEWNNLAEAPEHQARLNKLRKQGPKTFAPTARPKETAFQNLKWHPATETWNPAARPNGKDCEIVLTNRRKEGVDMYVLNAKGDWESRGSIQSGWRFSRRTQPGTVWIITDAAKNVRGHFVVGKGNGRATIPAAD